MSAVTLWNINPHKIAHRAQKFRNNRKSVLIKGFNAFTLKSNILIIGWTYKCPVRTAFIENNTEIPVNTGVAQTCL